MIKYVSSYDTSNSYTYTGREWDKETGLYYYRARYYDPMEGRFISKDPIGFDGGINLYAYVHNNAINLIDPFGLTAKCPSKPPKGNSKWKPYVGDTRMFHCGYEAYLENRNPTPKDPIAECVYDEKNNLVDEKHEYAGCRGTPDQYPASDYRHITEDTGGPRYWGIESFEESIRHFIDGAIK